MSKELDVQAKIRASVKKDNGYCHKLTNRFTVGIPDLLVALFPYMPCVLEIKDLGPVADDFDRQINVTPKQQYELHGISKVYHEGQHPYTPYRKASGVLVALVHQGKHRLVAVHTNMRGFSDVSYRLDAGYVADPTRWVERGVGGYYNLKPLLEHLGIARITPM